VMIHRQGRGHAARALSQSLGLSHFTALDDATSGFESQ
jgi:hypothetical protein